MANHIEIKLVSKEGTNLIYSGKNITISKGINNIKLVGTVCYNIISIHLN